MRGIVRFCAYKEVVQVAAPAINERKSRRLTRLQDATALELALFILLPTGYPSVADQSISRDARLVANGLRQASAGRHWLRQVEGNSEYRNSFVKSLDLAIPQSLQGVLAPDAFSDFGVHQDFPVCGRCAQAGREIYNAPDGGVIEPVLIPDPSNCCRSTGKSNAEPNLVAF